MSRRATGGLVERAKPLTFTFDGKSFSGLEGDTLASALVANDVKLIGRSFKYHRPRGILTAGSEEPNALVTLRSGARAEPNSRATTIELFDGLEASSQNCWPSPRFDLMAVNQLAAPLFVAGFYYKTFMRPAALWEKLYEPLIRRAAGLGALSGLPDPDSYDRDHGFCDLLIIGAGPAGLAAALTAGRAGLRVILADEDRQAGGRLLAERHEIDDMASHIWADRAAKELASLSNVRVLNRTAVVGVYDGREYAAVERLTDHLHEKVAGNAPRQRYWKIVAKHALLASGAIERPLVFGGNDRPGIMTASAVSTYINRFAALPGKRAVVITAGDSGWQSAIDMMDAGIEVAAVIDPRSQAPACAEKLRQAGTEIHMGARLRDAYGVPVKKVDIALADGGTRTISCDLVAMSGGWNPAIGLGSNMGARPVWSDAINSFVLDATPPGFVAAGAADGKFSLNEALSDGAAKAAAVVESLGKTAAVPEFSASDEGSSVEPLWHVKGRGKTFVDFQHDVTDKDIALSAREGFTSIEHLKRYTTLGMATDQGKTSQLNAHALIAAATGKTVAEAGTILSRAPYQPVAIGLFAGHHRDEHFRPVRLTSSHKWASERGADFVDVGQWKRARWFTRPGEADWLQSVNREVEMTRGSVGICDVSTLGKIDVQGPDAGLLLDRLYINMFSTLKVGKARYGMMLREDGFAMDDGVTTRFAEDSYFLTTTTANAGRVMQHIDYARQVLWPDLDVQATSVTEQWATYSIAGPNSRALLQRAFPDLDLSNDAMPFMGAAKFRWDGLPARIFRVSFSGEMAFEVSAPAAHGERLIRHLMEAGAEFDVVPYGTEALGVMRIEKGHAAGPELNGTTTAADLGMGRMMSSKKDFIGRIMAARPGLTDPVRPVLVGLKPLDRKSTIRSGAHLVAAHVTPNAENDAGYVTSAAYSPTLGHPIALALLSLGAQRHGEHVTVHDPLRGADVMAEVCDPVFVDPEGERMRG